MNGDPSDHQTGPNQSVEEPDFQRPYLETRIQPDFYLDNQLPVGMYVPRQLITPNATWGIL
jgi:hypothetical protein